MSDLISRSAVLEELSLEFDLAAEALGGREACELLAEKESRMLSTTASSTKKPVTLWMSGISTMTWL